MTWDDALNTLITQLPLVAYVVWRLEGRVRKMAACLERLRADVDELRRRSDPPPPEEEELTPPSSLDAAVRRFTR